MQIRAATSNDLPGILDIYNDAILTTTAVYDEVTKTLEDRAAWLEDHQRQGYPVLVAADEAGHVLGWSSLSRFHAKPGYRFTAEDSVYVAASQRGRGLGRELLAPLIGVAQDLNLRTIVALIDGANEASLKLHHKFGFETVGCLRQAGFKFDRWLDVHYLQLLLP